MFDANHVFGSRLLEDATNKLRVASGNEDKLKLALVLSYHLLKLLSTYQFAASFFVLQYQEISLALVLLIELLAHLQIIEEAMSTEV